MMRIKKAQPGRLIRKAANKTLAVYKNSAGKIYKRDTEKSLEREALQDIKKKYAPKNKLEKKIDTREKKIKRDNDAYDKALWESYQRYGGKTRKRMQAGGVAGKQPRAGMVDPRGAWTKVQERNLPPARMKKGGKMTKAKDGKWIQKAVNPKHKGYCTPMTKATCTPRRKALAMTFKKMARARKGK